MTIYPTAIPNSKLIKKKLMGKNFHMKKAYKKITWAEFILWSPKYISYKYKTLHLTNIDQNGNACEGIYIYNDKHKKNDDI